MTMSSNAQRWIRRCSGMLAGGMIACNGAAITEAPSETTDDPALAQFVASDLLNFWAAYDAGAGAAAFQSLYIDKASPGLKDFIAKRAVTAASLQSMVQAAPRFFASIHAINLQLASEQLVRSRIRMGYATIKQLYPPSVFPPVTFLVGRFSTAGTTSENGMLIGTEFFSMAADTPTDELPAFQRANVRMIDSLPFVVAHEHVHILQARATGLITRANPSLLEQALTEGAADFIGELVSGGNINGQLRDFAIPREHDLFAEFRLAMHGTDVSQWLYNQGNPPPDRPGDLGYFIGYRIAEAYYNRATDKAAAIRAIIEMRNADSFLVASGYDP